MGEKKSEDSTIVKRLHALSVTERAAVEDYVQAYLRMAIFAPPADRGEPEPTTEQLRLRATELALNSLCARVEEYKKRQNKQPVGDMKPNPRVR